jgi:hypothetical protein
MRWTAFTEILPHEHYTQLVNALTLGWGYARLAVQCAADNRPAATVFAHLRRAAGHYRVAYPLLTASEAPPFRLPTDEPMDSWPAVPWRDFLRSLPADRGPATQRLLADLVIDARRVAESIATDSSVTFTARCITVVLARLDEARRVGHDPPRP